MLPVRGVGQQVYPVALGLELFDQLLHALDGQDRTVPLVHKRVHRLVQALRQAAAHAFRRLGLGQRAAVHPGPFEGLVDLAQQQVLILLRRAGALDEIGGVEAEQDLPHIKDDVPDHTRILPLVTRSAMIRIRPLVTVRMAERAAPEPTELRTMLV